MVKQDPKFNIPTILVVFGATGDLMRKKIIPALYYLFEAGHLPKKFQIIAYSRRPWSDDDYRQTVLEALDAYYKDEISAERRQEFLTLFNYQQGTFEDAADYKKLGEKLGNIDGMWKICTNKLFYLAVPPQYYKDIFEHLKSSHLTDPCSPEEGWTRVLVEKPFGDDEKTARNLDQMLAELFKEEQIYRIDHYLAKEMLQNILAFRFSNNLFEQTWSNQFIERIDIRLLETIGVEDRGPFYDKVGALRDVGQNHLLQMLALTTMEHPQTLEANAIRAKRAEIMKTIKPLTPEEMKQRTFRAQYEGYREISGVAPDSQTETYFRICTQLNSPRWQGVPITLESGKRMGQPVKEIEVTFKHPMPCLCPPDQEHYKNKIKFTLEPAEGITIDFYSKKPGFELSMEERSIDFVLHQHNRRQYVEEYAKLLIDAVHGDQTLFISTEEVYQMWRATDPIVKAWQEGIVPLQTYAPDSAGVTAQASECVDCKVHHSGTPDQQSTKVNEIGILGLGKMGAGAARNLLEKGWRVVGYNRSSDDTKELEKEGLVGAYSLEEFVSKLPGPRIVWLMLPAGQVIDDIIFGENGLTKFLEPGDLIVDAGNSFYKDSIRRADLLKTQFGLSFVDVGFSGGPGGARNGACLMIGGEPTSAVRLEAVARSLSKVNAAGEPAYQFFPGVGAGHFVKMIHNGIEYGMMQAIAEGFAVMNEAPFQLNLEDVAKIYNNGSVIESRLVGWLQSAFKEYGQSLDGVSGVVKHTGEGAWTVETAKELGIPIEIIEGALEFRKMSEQNPTYTGQVVAALRGQFGGHSVK